MSPLVVKVQVKLHFAVTLLLSFADTGTMVCQDRKVHRSQPKDSHPPLYFLGYPFVRQGK